MGRKATSYLIYLVTIYSTIIVALLSIIAWLALDMEPEKHWLFPLLGLGVLPLLVLDFIFLIFWICKLKLWALAPAIAIALNFGFISATFQIKMGGDKTEQPYNFKIATYNVHSFKHGNFGITVETIARHMKEQGVDVLCMQEFEARKDFPADSIVKIFDFLPHFYSPQNKGGSDIAIFSKYPIEKTAFFSFPDTDNSALWIDITVDGHKLKVINAHFQTTNINQSQDEINVLKRTTLPDEQDQQALETVASRLHNNFIKRAEQARVIHKIITGTKDRSVILCGDFNDTPASYVYKYC